MIKNNPPELQPHNPPVQNYADDEIDLRELFSAIWAGKWVILAVTAVFAIGSVIYAINQPNIYKAQVLLAPASSGSGGGLSSMARQFGGLASLAGINLGGGGSTDKTTLAIEVMKSRQFITDFIQKYDLLVPLIAAKGWSEEHNKLLIDPELYDERKKTWRIANNDTEMSAPTMWDAYKAFNKIISASQAKDSGLVSVSIEHLSPYVAKDWVEWLVRDLNAGMKEKDVAEAKNSIEFLKAQLKSTQLTDMQNVFYQLIEEQTKTIMLSEVRDEYVFETVDPAVVPEEKEKPKRALICVVGVLIGFVLSIFSVITRYFLIIR